MADDINPIAVKKHRSEISRRIKTESNRAIRLTEDDILAEEVQTLLELLLLTDILWLEFEEDHNYLRLTIDTMEENQTGSSQTISITSGKDMKTYRGDAKKAYDAGVKVLKERIIDVRKLQKLAKENMKKHVAEKNVKDRTRSLQKAWRRIGDSILEDLGSLRTWTSEEQGEMRIKLEETEGCLAQLSRALEALVQLDLSSVQEDIEKSQDLVTSIGDKCDEVYYALQVSQQIGASSPAAGPPPTTGLGRTIISRVERESIRANGRGSRSRAKSRAGDRRKIENI